MASAEPPGLPRSPQASPGAGPRRRLPGRLPAAGRGRPRRPLARQLPRGPRGTTAGFPPRLPPPAAAPRARRGQGGRRRSRGRATGEPGKMDAPADEPEGGAGWEPRPRREAALKCGSPRGPRRLPRRPRPAAGSRSGSGRAGPGCQGEAVWRRARWRPEARCPPGPPRRGRPAAEQARRSRAAAPPAPRPRSRHFCNLPLLLFFFFFVVVGFGFVFFFLNFQAVAGEAAKRRPAEAARCAEQGRRRWRRGSRRPPPLFTNTAVAVYLQC